jgi:phosphatidylglycerophosphate synthase
VRDFLYAVLFVSIGWVAWHGLLAWLFAAILVAEIIITLWDFLEEDRTRKLPPGERVGHAVMGIIYGVFLAYLTPEVVRWMSRPTGFFPVDHTSISWLLTIMGAGVLLSGVRDLLASRRLPAASTV